VSEHDSDFAAHQIEQDTFPIRGIRPGQPVAQFLRLGPGLAWP